MPAQIIDKRATLARYDWLDNRDYAWFAERIPYFESPDTDIDATYYYRWELVTKHLTYGDPTHGYTFTEFIDRPFWSGAYGAISCPLGHQLAEVRWLKDRRITDDFARYWFEAPGAQPRSYSNWYGDAIWGTYLVNGDRRFLRAMLPHMKAQYAGWVAERYDATYGLFHWDGLHDGMERNINSFQTDDVDTGADGYRPTLNSYLFADARAISLASATLGDSASAREYAAKAATIKRRVQEELWDPRRELFLHQWYANDRDGTRAKTRTYESGKYAGDAHGRELIGYVPWQFSLPDSGYERAWRFVTDTAHFAARFGPTTTERHDPQFLIAPRCCHWSGNSWPYATTQTLVAMTNLLHDYRQSYVTSRDWMDMLRTYTRTQRKNGRPYIAESANPDNGSWDGADAFQHSEHYFHSAYVDLIVTGLVGLRPRADDSLEVAPLASAEWAYFALDDVAYHGRRVSIVWDRDGRRYKRGRGLTLLVDGQVAARSPSLGRLVAKIPAPRPTPVPARRANIAVNNGRGAYPSIRASYSAPTTPAVALLDGAYRYVRIPPNRWTDSGSTAASASLVLDFGAPREVNELALYVLDDGAGAAIQAPARYAIEQWTGLRWAPVASSSRVVGREANRVRFGAPVRASALRVTLTHRPGAWVGLSEIEAWTSRDEPLGTTSAAMTATASFAARGAPASDAVDSHVALTYYSRNRWSTVGSPNAVDTLTLDFAKSRTVESIDVYPWTNGRDQKAPSAIGVQRWTGKAWEDVRVIERRPARPLATAVNVLRLQPNATTRLRLLFTHDALARTAITEVLVWGPPY